MKADGARGAEAPFAVASGALLASVGVFTMVTGAAMAGETLGDNSWFDGAIADAGMYLVTPVGSALTGLGTALVMGAPEPPDRDKQHLVTAGIALTSVGLAAAGPCAAMWSRHASTGHVDPSIAGGVWLAVSLLALGSGITLYTLGHDAQITAGAGSLTLDARF